VLLGYMTIYSNFYQGASMYYSCMYCLKYSGVLLDSKSKYGMYCACTGTRYYRLRRSTFEYRTAHRIFFSLLMREKMIKKSIRSFVAPATVRSLPSVHYRERVQKRYEGSTWNNRGTCRLLYVPYNYNQRYR
jgi:hypothetical protein